MLIYVKRRVQPRPSEQLSAEKSKLMDYIEQVKSNRNRSNDSSIRVSRGYYMRSISELDATWNETIREQFAGKCAYCESFIGPEGIVEHFRPVNGVKDSEIGRIDPNYHGDHHYVWLTYEWSNLLYCCKECNSIKGNYFPVLGNRARVFTLVRNESPLLIDPCKDLPEEHLYYDEEGRLVAKSVKGDTTIDLLDLNRKQLVVTRAAQITRIQTYLGQISNNSPHIHVDVDYFNAPQYLKSLVRQFFAEWILGLNEQDRTVILSSPAWNDSLKSIYGNFKTSKQIMDIMNRYNRNTFYTGAIVGKLTSFKGNRMEWLRIRNVRGVTFDHTFEKHEKNESWLMLLGENGTGKTTVLKAIAMALSASWNGLAVKSSSYLTNGDEAEIEIKLQGYEETIRLRIHRNDVVHHNHHVPLPVIGYGAIRLIPSRHRRKKDQAIAWQNIGNLFATSTSGYLVNHPGEWLDENEALQQSVARMILDVLPFGAEENVSMIIERGKAFIELNGRRIPLHELSSGYQSVIALITDIARTLHKTAGLGKFAEGVLLIDEIDAHLHPSWKLNIVSKLREAFPGMQVIVTSHDPLCLRGTHNGELAVMKKLGDEVTVMKELPDQKGMRVDQILTSEFFDLPSTIGSEFDRVIMRYQQLLSNDQLNAAENEELLSLERQLDEPSTRYLGYTNRERLMYKTIDQFIAKRRKNRVAYSELDEETQNKLLQIWETDEEDV